MTLPIDGMACLGSFGFGARSLIEAGPLLPAQEDGRAKDADVSTLKELFPARSLRQMDRFTRMALLCMADVLRDAGTGPDAHVQETAIILVTGYGPATPTFAFLDSLLAHGEEMASPLSFSHSVHNIPAASLAMSMGFTGPCLTLCQRDNPVAAGFLAARQWLAEGRAARVLLGAVDEHTPLLAEITGRIVARRRAASSCREGLRTGLPISEGAAFFCLGPAGREGRRGTLDEIFIRRSPAADSAGRAGEDEAMFLSGAVPPDLLGFSGAHHAGGIYGNIPVAQAFDLILALGCRERAPSGRALCCGLGARGETSVLRVRRADAGEDAP